MIAVKIDHGVVNDALSDALGRQVTAQIDFQPTVSATSSAVHSWLKMLLMLTEHLFAPGSVLTQPLVRFAAAHTTRYGETPAVTLRRTT